MSQTVRVSAIETALHDKFPNDKLCLPHSVIKVANDLITTFTLQPAEIDTVVDIVKHKLLDIFVLHNRFWYTNRRLWTMPLYKKENNRTKQVKFYADHAAKNIDTIEWEILDSDEDHITFATLHQTMAEIHQDSMIKQAWSERDARNIILNA